MRMAFPKTPRDGTMVKTVPLLVALVLSASWACNARELLTNGLSSGESMTSDVSVLQIHCKESEVGAKDSKVSRNKNLCTLCEEFATQAVDYLEENNTQTQIIDILHKACSQLHHFERHCIALVDYYIPLFFQEVESVKPEDFCQKVNLCKQKLVTSWPLSGDKCDICRDAIAEVLLKLKDPDTKLDILEVLLKACDAVESHMKKVRT
ncbi:uncharacterized protein LOC127787836 [Diospyros lotus]|uniref:uncharacterized protein LOC127787836 n=1 Tax=Diospyros lotus TaxID=55363 RepID=UPI002252D586|nr:uncharacterized protein LOC127787836 [Diospyros lotus]